MSAIFIISILATAALLSWPLGRAMTWAMNPGEKGRGLRHGIDTFFQKTAGPASRPTRTFSTIQARCR